MLKFENKQGIVTGAGGGIGLAIAKSLLEEGATVHLADIDSDKLNVTAGKLTDYQDRISCHCLDICHADEITTMLARLNRVDFLVHSAALLNSGSLLEQSAEQFEQMLAVNLMGSFQILQQVSQAMVDKKQGAIVVIGSNAGSTPRLNIGGYGAAKAGVHMLTKNFALELSRYGIRCNVVSPGSTRTNMLTQTWNDAYGEGETLTGDLAQYRLGIPLQKIAEPSDIAQAVLFLLSEAAGHITMHDLRIDGGASLSQI